MAIPWLRVIHPSANYNDSIAGLLFKDSVCEVRGADELSRINRVIVHKLELEGFTVEWGADAEPHEVEAAKEPPKVETPKVTPKSSKKSSKK